MSFWRELVGTSEFRAAWKEEVRTFRFRWIRTLSAWCALVGLLGLFALGLTGESLPALVESEKEALASLLTYLCVGGFSISMLSMAFLMRAMWRVKNRTEGRPGLETRLSRAFSFFYLLSVGLAFPVTFALGAIPEEHTPQWLTDWFEADV